MLRFQKENEVCYDNFKDILYDVRFEIATSKIMDTSLGELEEIILAEFQLEDANGDDLLAISLARDCLAKCRKLSLTPF